MLYESQENTQIRTRCSRQFLLEGKERLYVETKKAKYEVTNRRDEKERWVQDRKLIPGTEAFTTKCFELREVDASELEKLRKSGVSGFVLKDDDHCFFAEIPSKFYGLYNTRIFEEDTHKCADCKRLSAALDKDGGCAKVRYYARCIERFTWIKKGFETFNTDNDAFVVCSCDNYEKYDGNPYPIAWW